MKSSTLLVLFFSLWSLTEALTTSINPTCTAVSAVVSILHAYPSVSPFCSSFLKYTTSTSTIVSTTTATASSLTTVTTTSPVTNTATSTSTSTFVTTVTVTNPTTQAATVTAPEATVTAPATTSTVTSGTTTVCGDPTPLQKRAATSKLSTSSSSVRSSTTLSTITTKLSSTSGLPSPVASFASSAISSACSCLSIPRPSTTTVTTSTVTTTNIQTTTVATTAVATTTSIVTETSTSTVTATLNTVITSFKTVTPSTTVTPTETTTVVSTTTATATPGIEFAVYQNSPGTGDSNGYKAFNEQQFKSKKPEQTGTTDSIGLFRSAGDSTISIYGGPTRSTDSFVVDHRFYIYAPSSGTYTIKSENIDDIFLVWIGPNAYSGWNRGNADLVCAYSSPCTGSSTISLTAGQYYPARVMFGQGYKALEFNFAITGSGGSPVIVGAGSNSVFTQGCDSRAKAFPPWGAET